jgi:hypothetical protein
MKKQLGLIFSCLGGFSFLSSLLDIVTASDITDK